MTAARLGIALAVALGLSPLQAVGEEKPAGIRPSELEMAATARPSVVRVRWRDARFGDVTTDRNAIVVRRDGLLLMAGPPPSERGTLTAHFADGRTLRAQMIAADAQVLLTLLRVPTTGLRPLRLDPAKPVPGRVTLPAPPLGQRLLMVNGSGAVAAGPVRAHGRHGSAYDPARRRTVHTPGLFAAAMAAVDEDAGSPLLDADGGVAGLLVGRRTALNAQMARAARLRGLVVRPEPTEVLAVPASVAALVWPLLESEGRLPRAGLDIDTTEADATLREHLGLEEGGHLVSALVPGGTGAQQGLALHDILIAFDGRTFPPGTSLHDVLLPFRPGTKVLLRYVRAGKTHEREIVLGERSSRR